MWLWSRLKVRHKLIVLSVTFLLPIGFLAYLFIAQTQKDVDFAALELTGNAYFSALRAELGALIDLGQRRVGSTEVQAVQRAVLAADAALAAAVNATAAADQAAGAVQAALVMPPDGTPAALDAVQAQMTQVADGSNLTLDPELDSYYMQDAVTVKLPALVLAAGRALDAALDWRASVAPTAEQTVRLLRHATEYAVALNGLAGDLTSAARGNPDGSVKAALDGVRRGFDDQAGVYARLLGALTAADAERPDAAALQAAQWRMQEAARALWAAGAQELDHLLAARIAGLQARMYWGLGLTLAVLTISLLLAWAIAVSISRPLQRQRHAMHAILQGAAAVEVPYVTRGDEIGAIAASVKILKDHMVRGEQLATEHERERERTTAEKRAALMRMADMIEAETATALGLVGEHSAAMAATAEEMHNSAARTGTAAQSAATAASQALANAQTVASAADQLTASIHEISSQVGQSAAVVGRAIKAGDQTRATIETLTSQFMRVGTVADMIGEIAARTSLLALNATIEAALHIAFVDAGLPTAEVDRISLETIPELVRLTKADHLVFVQKVTDAVEGRVQQSSGTLANHHECRLGRWYDGVSDPIALALPAFAALKQPHQGVHSAGHSALAAAEAGDMGAARQHVAMMRRHSENILLGLDAFGAAYVVSVGRGVEPSGERASAA